MQKDQLFLVAMSKAFQLDSSKAVLAICPDRGEKYLVEFYDDDWLIDRGLQVDDQLKTLVVAAKSLKPVGFPREESFGCTG